MNKRLADREFLAGDYSIADMACVGWAQGWERQGQDIDEFPALQALARDHAGAPGRPARPRRQGEAEAYDLSKDKDAQAVLFGQRAR